MALVVKDFKRPATPLQGTVVERVFTFTTDTDYAAGGYALTDTMLGFESIELVSVGPSGGYIAQYNYATEKLMILEADNDAGADSALIEVSDGENAIADLVFRGIVQGVAL